MLPNSIPNWIGGEEAPAADGGAFDKLNPADGTVVCKVARSRSADVKAAVAAAAKAQNAWSEMPAVKRGEALLDIVNAMKANQEEIARVIALETGKAEKGRLG